MKVRIVSRSGSFVLSTKGVDFESRNFVVNPENTLGFFGYVSHNVAPLMNGFYLLEPVEKVSVYVDNLGRVCEICFCRSDFSQEVHYRYVLRAIFDRPLFSFRKRSKPVKYVLERVEI